ncbi:hypothetical protein JTB14_033682 [Gonioctena quinquepunctata]|nr:hypothetical protein JTB14_033682 [Gonioctena quinquepunctata]
MHTKSSAIDSKAASSVTPRAEPEDLGNSPPIFTLIDLVNAAAKLETRKLPVPDGITAEAIKLAVEVIPEVILTLFNEKLSVQEYFSLPMENGKGGSDPKGLTG